MVMQRVEKTFGLPPISKLAESLDKFPDAKQLRLIKDVLIIAERVSQTAPELDQVIMIIREINSMPTEKLEKLEKVFKRIEGIIKKAPEELVSFLGSLKGE